MPRLSLEQRFWAKVNKTDSADECWEWTASKDAKGYGYFYKEGRGGMARAHRISYELNLGPIPAGLLVCHKCDNPGCINPNHLFLGTDKDNSDDKMKKGRFKKVYQRGEKNGQSKLTGDQVKEIRARLAAGEAQPLIAAEYGIAQSTVSKLNRAARWGHTVSGVINTRNKANSKITPDDVREIRRRYAAGEKQKDIRMDYGISESSISEICSGKRWANVV
jgi:DNA-binding transcriptional regulator YiaG